MPPDALAFRGAMTRLPAWPAACARLLCAWLVLFAVTFGAWRAMAHQWWNIDTYHHVLLIPLIVAWLVWLRREELGRITPAAWWPGIVLVVAGLMAWLAGTAASVNVVAQGGALLAFQGAAITLLGVRAALVLAFPLLYAGFLVPFGDELIPLFQRITADLAISLTHLSGVPATRHGLYIDTPAGLFVVAEECSGVKFLIAMVALSVLIAWTGFRRWPRRIALVVAAAAVSVAANGVRAWGTIRVAQTIGIERASGFDHIVYGWFFFGIVIALVLGAAWHFLERTPEEAGLTADQAAAHPWACFERHSAAPATAIAAIVGAGFAFAVLGALV